MGILDITDGGHPLLRRPFLDEEAPEAKPGTPTQTTESVVRDESTDDQDEGQAKGQPHQDQATRIEETDHGETDESSTDDNTVATSVHRIQSSAPTTDSARERALD